MVDVVVNAGARRHELCEWGAVFAGALAASAISFVLLTAGASIGLSLISSLRIMKTIQTYFKKLGRQPTDVELESIAQTWSEHCKHTIFADPIDELKDGLFKTYIKGATEKIRKQKKGKVFAFRCLRITRVL